MTESPMSLLSRAFSEMEHKVDMLEESLAQKVLSLEDIGWTKLAGQDTNDGGLTLGSLHDLTPNLRDMAATNPLLKRGAQLRHAYVFGRGINFTGLTPKTQAAIDNDYNKAALFSVQGYAMLNLAKYTDGNVFILRDATTNILTLVPVGQITGSVTDPDDNSKVRYFKRAWSSDGKQYERWYPVSRYKKTQVGRGKRGGKINKTISSNGRSVPVDQNSVIYHETSNRQVGWTYGVPDSLAASVWTVSYSEYLSDNAALVKALQQIAWTITNSSKKGSTNAAMAVAQPGTGGTAVMGGGNSLASAGVPSAQVNMNNGQPLAAMVATSLGVPVIALLSSPGATGGSYGAATTLDEPTLKGMSALQDEWKVFYSEILSDMGSPEAEVGFPNISQDPTYREQASLASAYTTGAIHQDEYREATLALMDIRKLHTELPEPDEFNTGHVPGDEQVADPVASQGNTGAVPGGMDRDETNHDPDSE